MLSIYKSHIDLLGDTEGLTFVTEPALLIREVSLLEGLTLVTETALLIRGLSL